MSDEDEANNERRRPPAVSPEAREQELMALAVDLTEKKLRDGTASAPLIIHYLKAASPREKEEREKLRRENELLRMKSEAIVAQQESGVKYQEVLDAIRKYSGNND